MSPRFARFCVIGTVGFAVDAGLVTLFVSRFGIDPYSSRFLSFPVAVTVTWYLNRIWSFSATRTPRRGREYRRYALVQSTGVAANILTYSLVILLGPAAMERFLIVPLALGAAVGLAINYIGAKRWVFIGGGAD